MQYPVLFYLIESIIMRQYIMFALPPLIISARYTDFIVNEIAPDGTVVHLATDKVPKFRPSAKVRPITSLFFV